MHGSCSTNPADFNFRLGSVDVLRFFCFYTIVIFHTTFALWARYGFDRIPFDGPWIWPIETFGRIFAFSGFAVLFLSFFLYGLRPSRKFHWLPLALIGFAVLWNVTVAEFPYWWDIYPFLLVSFGVLALVKRWNPWVLTLLGAGLVSVPFWRFFEDGLPVSVAAVFTGACRSRNDLGEWPLMPWVFYPVFAFGLGRLGATIASRLSHVSKFELLGWIGAFALCVPSLGSYYSTPLGESFGCFVFRQAPVAFWAQQLVLLAVVRVGFLSGPNWFSSSPVNRHFFAVYALHLPFIHFLAWCARVHGWDHQPWILALVLGVTFAIIESTRGLYGKGTTQSHKLLENLRAQTQLLPAYLRGWRRLPGHNRDLRVPPAQ